MHLEDQTEAAPRRRRSYTKQYKAELVAQCLQPHVSIASIALAHGLNANLLRRWVVEHKQCRSDAVVNSSLRTPEFPDKSPAFIELQPALHAVEDRPCPAQAAQITIELPSGQGPVRLHWPAEHADRLAVCLKVFLT